MIALNSTEVHSNPQAPSVKLKFYLFESNATGIILNASLGASCLRTLKFAMSNSKTAYKICKLNYRYYRTKDETSRRPTKIDSKIQKKHHHNQFTKVIV